MSAVVTGLERLLRDGPKGAGNPRIGLITNHTGVTHTLVHTTDALFRAGFRVDALFAPEHGIRGEDPGGDSVASTIDPETDLPLHSLFGERVQPTADMLVGLDVLVFDIQDVGARFYTYTSTLVHCLTAAAERGMRFIVLDRPAPITAYAVEGPVLEPGSPPVRRSNRGAHSLWHYRRRAGAIRAPISWPRRRFARRADRRLDPAHVRGTTRPAFLGSPRRQISLPLTRRRCTPGTCLFEGTNLSEGRGTTKPFELIGAPWVDGRAMTARLNGLALPGCRFRSVSFLPAFNTRASPATACSSTWLTASCAAGPSWR